jgi:hypothetical protein
VTEAVDRVDFFARLGGRQAERVTDDNPQHGADRNGAPAPPEPNACGKHKLRSAAPRPPACCPRDPSLVQRSAPRRRGPKVGVLLLEQDALIECTVRDFSSAGVGLLLPDVIALPDEFGLTFSRSHHHCITVWRQLGRMGLKFKSML